jgi:penicillin-binding protein 1A
MASNALIRARRYSIISLKVMGYGLLLALISLGVAVSVAVSQLPSYEVLLRRDNLGQMIRVRAVDGSIIHTQGPSFGEWLPYERIPENMRNAMVAIEDRRFDWHPGVDPIGIAARSRCASGPAIGARAAPPSPSSWRATSSSTTPAPSAARCARRSGDARWECRFTKEQILDSTSNRVYFGGGAYGIDAASRRFFGHSAPSSAVDEARRSSPAWSRRRPVTPRPATSRPLGGEPASCSTDAPSRNISRPPQASAANPQKVRLDDVRSPAPPRRGPISPIGAAAVRPRLLA